MKNLLIAAMAIFMSISVAQAQQIAKMEDPIQWTYSIVKTQGDEYKLVLYAQLEKGWHIFSQTPGGDGLLIPPSFQVNDNLLTVNKDGTLNRMFLEEGKLINATLEGIDGAVHFYEREVTFSLPVKLSGKGLFTIKGTHEYQLCNDRMCLPPVTKNYLAHITLY